MLGKSSKANMFVVKQYSAGNIQQSKCQKLTVSTGVRLD